MLEDPVMIKFMTEVSSLFAASRQVPWLIDVEEYMAQLPNHIVPRVNSSGEKYREKQLLTQLPRQDLSVAYCRHLGSNAERKVGLTKNYGRLWFFCRC
ncbi:PET domain protein [Cooperia oncophora]